MYQEKRSVESQGIDASLTALRPDSLIYPNPAMAGRSVFVMRTCLMVAMLAVVLLTATVAGASVSTGVGASILSETPTDVTAGINAQVTLHDGLGGKKNGWAEKNNFIIPISSSPVTLETSWIRIAPEILDIPQQYLLSTNVLIEDNENVFRDDSGAVWVNCLGLGEGKYTFIIQASHTASRVDQRWFIFIKHAKHVLKTDERGFSFAVQNVDEDVQDFVTNTCRAECYSRLSERQQKLLRSDVYGMFTEQIGLCHKPLDYRSGSVNHALLAQGQRGPLQEGPMPPNPEVQALRLKVGQLEQAISGYDALAQDNARLKAERDAAEAKLKQLEELRQAPPIAIPPTFSAPSSLTAVPGQLVICFRAASPDGQPVACPIWACNETRVVPFPKPIMVAGEYTYTLSLAALSAQGWTAVRVGDETIQATSGVRMVAYEGGGWHVQD